MDCSDSVKVKDRVSRSSISAIEDIMSNEQTVMNQRDKWQDLWRSLSAEGKANLRSLIKDNTTNEVILSCAVSRGDLFRLLRLTILQTALAGSMNGVLASQLVTDSDIQSDIESKTAAWTDDFEFWGGSATRKFFCVILLLSGSRILSHLYMGRKIKQVTEAMGWLTRPFRAYYLALAYIIAKLTPNSELTCITNFEHTNTTGYTSTERHEFKPFACNVIALSVLGICSCLLEHYLREHKRTQVTLHKIRKVRMHCAKPGYHALLLMVVSVQVVLHCLLSGMCIVLAHHLYYLVINDSFTKSLEYIVGASFILQLNRMINSDELSALREFTQLDLELEAPLYKMKSSITL